MPGKVVRLLVAVGDAVEAGQGLIVVEAMKMQNEMKSPKAGMVVEMKTKSGATVTAGEILLLIAVQEIPCSLRKTHGLRQHHERRSRRAVSIAISWASLSQKMASRWSSIVAARLSASRWRKEVKPAKYTVLGWDVKDVRATVLDLKKAGIACEIFGFFKQDDLGIWTAPGGDSQSPGLRTPKATCSPFLHYMPDANCKICDGTGWKIVERGGLSGAERCECSYATRNHSHQGKLAHSSQLSARDSFEQF